MISPREQTMIRAADSTNSLDLNRLTQSPVRANIPRIRADFERVLQQRLSPSLDDLAQPPATDIQANLRRAFAPVLQEGRIDTTKLPEAQFKELQKLQTASEQFEAHFVRGLLAQMRASAFGQSDSAMTQFAKDTLDQAVAESTAQGQASLGIARKVFAAMGETIVRQAVGELARQNSVAQPPSAQTAAKTSQNIP